MVSFGPRDEDNDVHNVKTGTNILDKRKNDVS